MTRRATAGVATEKAGNTRLSLLLAAAMFVLVVDTSLMNVYALIGAAAAIAAAVGPLLGGFVTT